MSSTFTPPRVSSDEFEAEIDLGRILKLLRRTGWIWILGALLTAGAAYGFSRLRQPVYAAETQVMVVRPSSQQSMTDLTQALNIHQLTQTYVELLSQDWVREEVAQRIGDEIKEKQIQVKMATNTPLIYITVEDEDPARAVQIANMLVTVLIERNNQTQAERYDKTEEDLSLQIADLEAKIAVEQTNLETARLLAYNEKLKSLEERIQTLKADISLIQDEIARIKSIATVWNASSLLSRTKAKKSQVEATLTAQQEQLERLKQQAIPEPESEADITVEQFAKVEQEIQQNQQQLEQIEKEIEWLTPLAQPGGIEKAIQTKNDYLQGQQNLLDETKTSYLQLSISGSASFTNNEILKMEKTLGIYQQIYLNLLNSREQVRLQRLQNTANVIQLVSAVPSDKPVKPRIALNTAIGGAVGLMVAILLVFLTEGLNTTVKEDEEIEQRLGIPVIGYIRQIETKDKAQGPYVASNPRSPVSESFRFLRTNLEFAALSRPLKVILVTSPLPSDGKTTVAANLAAIYAQSGKSVLCVDGDLRRPHIHHLFGISNRFGLTDAFRHNVDLSKVMRSWNGNDHFSVITTGSLPPNPSELLASQRMRDILEEMRSLADVVIIDSSPGGITDAYILAPQVDGVLIVVWPRKTLFHALETTIEQLQRAEARIVGVVFNSLPRNDSFYDYGKYYHTSYYYSENEENVSKPRRGLKKSR